MNEPILAVEVVPAEAGWRVRAPLLGRWSAHPHPGALVGAGSVVGFLEHLDRRYRLVLPDGAAGRVRGTMPRDRIVAVEYGQTLFELAPLRADDAAGLEEEGRTTGTVVAGLPAGHHAVVAPTDGVFYRRPTPGARPFVQAGDRVRNGQPLGLIEVMKTFGQIPYGGPGLPEEAEVVEVRADDAAEVRAGDVLVVVR
ncbi:MAG TPA: biotin/lipoyl-containing protein [Candidatus Polarisedimenticolaceae bacterium]